MVYFVTGIGTDSGKTVVSAILTEFLAADYWKPIQAGLPRDMLEVQRLISNTNSKFFNEHYLLSIPASPHAAAKNDKISIDLKSMILPKTDNSLVVEGAGGVMVPLNDKDYIIDIVPILKAEVVLVADLYLGSINHTLLTIEYLKKRRYAVKGIVFNGNSNKESEDIIMKKSPWPCLLKIVREKRIDKTVIARYAEKLKETW